MTDEGQVFETVPLGGLMIRSFQGWEYFTNAFSINLKTVYIYLETLPIMKGYRFEDKALTSLYNYGSIYT